LANHFQEGKLIQAASALEQLLISDKRRPSE